jgi:hypothetical protein
LVVGVVGVAELGTVTRALLGIARDGAGDHGLAQRICRACVDGLDWPHGDRTRMGVGVVSAAPAVEVTRHGQAGSAITTPACPSARHGRQSAGPLEGDGSSTCTSSTPWGSRWSEGAAIPALAEQRALAARADDVLGHLVLLVVQW